MNDTTTNAALRAAQRVAGEQFAARLADLAVAALELVQVERTLRIAETQAGTYVPGGPPARDLATHLLHGRLGCLRLNTPFFTEQSADRAEEALCTSTSTSTRAKARS